MTTIDDLLAEARRQKGAHVKLARVGGDVEVVQAGDCLMTLERDGTGMIEVTGEIVTHDEARQLAASILKRNERTVPRVMRALALAYIAALYAPQAPATEAV